MGGSLVSRRRARVGGLCGFPGAAERVPAKYQKTGRCADVRGVLRKQQTQKKQACRQLPAGNRAASGEAGEKTWRFSAPACPRLPAVRAVLSGKNGAFLWVGKVDWRYFSGKAKIVPLLQA